MILEEYLPGHGLLDQMTTIRLFFMVCFTTVTGYRSTIHRDVAIDICHSVFYSGSGAKDFELLLPNIIVFRYPLIDLLFSKLSVLHNIYYFHLWNCV